MRALLISCALAASLLAGGCATRSAGGAQAGATAVVEEPRIAAVVNVPAAAAHKVVLSMTGSKVVLASSDWADFQQEWRDNFADYAKESGIEFSFVDGLAAPQGVDGTLLLVNVADYRMVSTTARILFGIMTGNAFIEANITFANLRDGLPFGEQHYSTSSSAWAGVFSKMTRRQVDTIGAEVFRNLKPATAAAAPAAAAPATPATPATPAASAAG